VNKKDVLLTSAEHYVVIRSWAFLSEDQRLSIWGTFSQSYQGITAFRYG
jgi:hypothetical protein